MSIDHRRPAADAPPDLSVIIPTHNRAGSVRRTLDALARQDHPADRFEVIVVANACTDDTADVVRRFQAPFALRFAEVPAPGVSLARNSGAAAARGRWLVFVDDDIEPLPTALAAHAAAHAAREDLVAVGPLLAPPLADAPGLLVERRRAADATFAALLASRAGALDWTCTIGGNMSLPATLFRRAGGFETALVAYGGEDYEFGCRAQRAGARFALLDAAGAYHHVDARSSLGEYLRRSRSVGRNEVLIVERHPQVLEAVTLGLLTRPQRRLGRLARHLAFDQPRLGDGLAHALHGVCIVLAGLRARHAWNRLVDGLSQYWYYRGVSDRLGDATAAAAFVHAVRQRRAAGAPGVS